MRNWIDYVRRHLSLPELKRDREAKIVEELARQLEDFYDEAKSCGATDEEADLYARQQISDWEGFAAELLRAERANIRPKIEEWYEQAEEAATRKGGRWRMFADMRRDLLYGIRMLIKKPGFTVVAVLMLALGIGANTAIFSVVNAVLLRPLPFPKPERLVTVWAGRDAPYYLSAPEIYDFKERQRSFDSFAAFHDGRAERNLTGGGEPTHVSVHAVMAEFFTVLGTRPILGRTFTQEEDQPGNNRVVVLEYGFWQRQFGGDPAIVGKTLALDGQSYQALGVMPPGFETPFHNYPTDMWAPLALNPSNPGPRDSYSIIPPENWTGG